MNNLTDQKTIQKDEIKTFETIGEFLEFYGEESWFTHFSRTAVPYVLGGLTRQIMGGSLTLSFDNRDLQIGLTTVCPNGRESLSLIWRQMKEKGVAFPHYQDTHNSQRRFSELMEPFVLMLATEKLYEYQSEYDFLKKELADSVTEEPSVNWQEQHEALLEFVKTSYFCSRKEMNDFIKKNWGERDTIMAKKPGVSEPQKIYDEGIESLLKRIASKRISSKVPSRVKNG